MVSHYIMMFDVPMNVMVVMVVKVARQIMIPVPMKNKMAFVVEVVGNNIEGIHDFQNYGNLKKLI